MVRGVVDLIGERCIDAQVTPSGCKFASLVSGASWQKGLRTR